MTGPRIATTQRDGLRPLGIHGQPVVESHAQITRYLREALSPAHAHLFAEPNPETRPGEIEWYAEPDGAAQTRAALDPAAQAALDAELKRLVDDIAARAALLRQSKEGGEQLLGELLALALRIPGDGYVYAIGAQPVLAAWGHVIDDPAADHTVLQKLAKAPPLPPRPPPVVPPPPRRAMWPWWLALLALMIGAGFLLPFLTAPLLAQLARPDSGFCAIPPEQRLMIATIDSEQSEEAALRRELTFVEAQIAEKAAQCRAPAQSARRPDAPQQPFPRMADTPRIGGPAGPDIPGGTADDPGGSERRDPDAPRADAPDRRDPPTPEQRADRPDARTNPPVPERRGERGQDTTPQTNPPRPNPPRTEDLRPRLEREHAQQGEASVSLAWNTQDDLDVVVVCPGNAQVGYRSPQGCGAQLDVDMNRGDPRSDTPVENITWPSVDAAPRGRYRVQIDNQSAESVPYRVRVTVRGETREYTGTAPPHARGHRVAEFDLPGQAPAAPPGRGAGGAPGGATTR